MENKFDERILRLEGKIERSKREIKEFDDMISAAEKKLTNYVTEISKLQRDAEIHILSKDERDSAIQKLFATHNLGSLPSNITDAVALDLTDRIESRLTDLDNVLQSKKNSNDKELKMAWDLYLDANERWKNAEAQKQAKLEIKNAILKRIEGKKIERDSLELQISDVDLSRIDEREKNMQIEVERRKNQLDQRNFGANIQQKWQELQSIDQKINDLNREKSFIAVDAEERVRLSLKKNDLENHKKKHQKL
ncbi:hypothetical protein SLEP1_g37668 [Rubroshorea leprosula]|nr:hypothetical protein SLEP1_g37668 [Rubroshorea leprosula]